MANRALTIDPVLAAIEAAPFVDDTDEERAHMAAVRAQMGGATHASVVADPSTAHEAVMARVKAHFEKK